MTSSGERIPTKPGRLASPNTPQRFEVYKSHRGHVRDFFLHKREIIKSRRDGVKNKIRRVRRGSFMVYINLSIFNPKVTSHTFDYACKGVSEGTTIHGRWIIINAYMGEGKETAYIL